MVILNCWGEIEPVRFSEKLGLYASNVVGSCHEDWAESLREEILTGVKVISLEIKKDAKQIENDIIALYGMKGNSLNECVDEIAQKMILLDLDYECEDMPMGGWETNCFDGRFCEQSYAEKLLEFFSFLSDPYEESELPSGLPAWIYSSSSLGHEYHRYLFWGGKQPDSYIATLRQWGKLLDGFLKTRDDYLLLDYMVNALYFDRGMDEYGLLKRYSLCQLFLEKKRESELDEKLVPFIVKRGKTVSDAEECARKYRRLRNKLAHGDFAAFDIELEQYAQRFMDGNFWFDYSEYSRRNWVVCWVCHELDYILKDIIEMLFTNRDELKRIKQR